MTPAPVPADEADRLNALRDLLLLDTPPEERYDRLARFVAEQLNVPGQGLGRSWLADR